MHTQAHTHTHTYKLTKKTHAHWLHEAYSTTDDELDTRLEFKNNKTKNKKKSNYVCVDGDSE